MRQSGTRAVSPVVAVILMVAVTVGLSTIIGLFVFDLGASVSDTRGSQTDIATSTSYTSDGNASVQVLTGDADKLRVLVNGSEAGVISQPSPGDTIEVEVAEGARISVIAVTDGESTLVTSDVSSQLSTSNRATLIDAFDASGNLSEYQDELEDFTLVSSPTYDGEGSLQGSATSSDGYNGIVSSSGLDAYPQAGDTFEIRVYHETTDSNSLVFFGTQTATNDPEGYYIRIRDGDSTLRLTKEDSSGTKADIDNASITVPTEEWLRVRVQWKSDGTMTATVYDESGTQLSQVSGQDTTYTSGGFGVGMFDGVGGDSVYFDNAVILNR